MLAIDLQEKVAEQARAATPGWNGADVGEPDNDEYRAQVAPAAGTYDTAYRFSGDGGVTWIYCDLDAGEGSDGSEDGYQADNAGSLIVATP